MKLLYAILLAFATVFLLGWGIVLTAHGNPWLLIVTVLLYGIGFVRYGCAAH